MKSTFLALLASATLADGGLTGTQIKQVIAFEDAAGFSFLGSQELTELVNGTPRIYKILLFYRATDDAYICCCPEMCSSAIEAEAQIEGSKLMWEIKGRLLPNQNSSKPTY